MSARRRASLASIAGISILAVMGIVAGLAGVLATDRVWVAEIEGSIALFRSPDDSSERLEPIVRAPIPFGPLDLDFDRALEPPSRAHPLGTDALGRDLASRLIHGARRSLLAALFATCFALAVGASIGSLAGIAPTAIDTLLSRVADVFNAFPVLIGAIAILGATGAPREPWIQTIWIGGVIGLFSWPALFRLSRAEVRRRAASDLAIAAEAVGARRLRLAIRHLAPHALSPLLAPAAFIAGGTVLAEAGLGFLGLGTAPPHPSWGGLLRNAWLEVGRSWWLVFFPGAAVFATVFAFQLLADGLRREKSAHPARGEGVTAIATAAGIERRS